MSTGNDSRGILVSVRRRLKTLLAVFGLTVLSLMVFEVGCRAILFLAARSTPAQVADPRDRRATLPAYDDARYDVDALFAEDKALRKSVYQPYVVWSRKPYDGQLIDIDAEGRRATFHSSDNAEALRLWMLGGSTMWGQGAPDAETIPSYVAQMLNQELDLDVQVENLGEIGYVSTQEIVALIRQLQLGRRPDFVIFFDGVNDAPAAALWPEILGTHMNFYKIRDRFEAPGRRQNRQVKTAIAHSGMVRFAALLSEKFGLSPAAHSGEWNAPRDAAEVRRRGETAARLWLENCGLIRDLGVAYGFVPIFVLQPSLLVGAKDLHPSEQELQITEQENEAKREGMAVYAEMRRAVREMLPQQDSDLAIYDASDLFADVAEPIYIDYVHMSGRGNRYIAAELLRLLKPHLCGDLPPRVSPHTRSQLESLCR